MNNLETSLYHSVLKIAAVVCAFVLMFQSGIFSPTTAILATNTQLYLANAVGVSVGVAPTELNQVTAMLTQKEQELAALKLEMNQREINLGLSTDSAVTSDTTTFVLGAILFILLLLIVLNYALDYVRSREIVGEYAV